MGINMYFESVPACLYDTRFTSDLPRIDALCEAQLMINLCLTCPALRECQRLRDRELVEETDYQRRHPGWSVMAGDVHPRHANLRPYLKLANPRPDALN